MSPTHSLPTDVLTPRLVLRRQRPDDAPHELSDVAPPKVHITVPVAHRVQRTIPQYLVVHRADLRPEDVTALEGMPIVTPERAIRDGIAAHLGPALLGQAIDDGLRSGRLTRVVADQLRQDLEGGNAAGTTTNTRHDAAGSRRGGP